MSDDARDPAPGTDRRPIRRILLKISGEALGGRGGKVLDPGVLDFLAGEIAEVCSTGVELGIVLGGGNFVRGASLSSELPVGRVAADQMGMLATLMNALAVRDVLGSRGLVSRILAPSGFGGVAERFSRPAALEALAGGELLLLAGGTGHPFFTTDTAAALRAAEIGADVLAKATKVDGVYDRDPETDPAALRFDRLSCREILDRRLGVMDLTAITLCREAKVPIVVFDLFAAGALGAIARGKDVGTLVTPDD